MQRRRLIKLGAGAAVASVLARLKPVVGAVATFADREKMSAKAKGDAYFNPELPMDSRIANLIAQLNTREKISFLYFLNSGIPRLDIPQFLLGNEALHGLVRPGKNTVFPEAIGLGATFHPTLIHRMTTAISDEARARWNTGASDIHTSRSKLFTWPTTAKERRRHVAFIHQLNETLILFGPVVNMARDPRWGRTQETYGEDPHLTSQLGVAYVKGLQGDDPQYFKTIATLKHFAGYNVETNRFAFNAIASNRYWHEYEFVPYRACVTQANVQSVMGAYNAINGVPCCCNKWLLTDQLRNLWHFDGFVISDAGAVSHICGAHHYVKTPAEAAAAALNAGLDMELGWWSKYPNLFNDFLPEALEKKLVTMATIDCALTRVFRARFRLGMFDPPDRVPYAKIQASVIGCRKHIDLAREIARESIVLMQNNPTRDTGPLLPLNFEAIHRIAVVGNSAGRAEFGDYSGVSTIRPVTLIRALKERISKSRHKPEMRWIKSQAAHKPIVLSVQDIDFIKSAQAVFVCVTSPYAWEGHDQTHLELDADQEALVRNIHAVNPMVIVILYTGTAVAIPWIKKHVPAIVNAWYPGEQGGNAVADVLFGDYNPAGRLPLTYYAATDDLPPMDQYDLFKGRGRTYMYFKGDVLYPFGHGLSYTTFTYSKLRLSGRTFEGHERLIPHILTVQADVTNSGDRDGDEVVQVYIHQLVSPFPQPVKQLKAFSRIHIAKGKTQTVEFNLPLRDWALWDGSRNELRVFPGEYDVLVGASAMDIRLNSRVKISNE
jgi:beta-glucosidase